MMIKNCNDDLVVHKGDLILLVLLVFEPFVAWAIVAQLPNRQTEGRIEALMQGCERG